jgi:hypothetical protein
VPVRDAVTRAKFPSPGSYRVWVRTRDWVAPWKAPGAPGRFKLLVDGKPLAETFGTEGEAWHWQDGGSVQVAVEATVALHDLTGFEGRCDAVLFSKDAAFVPPNEPAALTKFRRSALGLPEEPEDGGSFDLVSTEGVMGASNLWNLTDVSDPAQVLLCECKDKEALSLSVKAGSVAAPFPRCPWAMDLTDRPLPGRRSLKGQWAGAPLDNLGGWFWESGFDKDQINDKGIYWAPYRCLYSRNVANLFMAGRDISVDHEALGPVRVMRTCGMMGEIVGKAAWICVCQATTPRGVYEGHLALLKELMSQPGALRRAALGGLLAP